MSFTQALLYFFREATVSIFRSWRISALAVFTITVSLFLAGLFLLVSSNLARIVDSWKGESKVLVYLETGADDVDIRRVRSQIAQEPWVVGAEIVTAQEARRRFSSTFPSLEGLLEGWGQEPLPASIEIAFDWARIDRSNLDSWARTLSEDPVVALVDDDQDWLEQLEAVVLILRGLGFVLGGILLLTAIFTISSVVRLTAFIYRDEIAVMRLVGATEFFIRGPFYVEGMIQGLAGASLAIVGLWGGYRIVLSESAGGLATSILADQFLSAGQIVALVGLGALAGLIGAITSLRREDLGRADA